MDTSDIQKAKAKRVGDELGKDVSSRIESTAAERRLIVDRVAATGDVAQMRSMLHDLINIWARDQAIRAAMLMTLLTWREAHRDPKLEESVGYVFSMLGVPVPPLSPKKEEASR